MITVQRGKGMKAVLVIDDMPMRCCECKYYRFADKYDCHRTICVINGERCENGIDYKPSVCPLKPLPKKMKRRATDEATDLIYSTGWNDCLAEMMGETE
jgi:hypothetical protein